MKHDKKESNMSWFNIRSIKDEIRKIEWPKRKQMTKDTGIVLGFIGFFVVYFLVTEIVISGILKVLKVF